MKKRKKDENKYEDEEKKEENIGEGYEKRRR